MNIREATQNDIKQLADLASKTYSDAFGHVFTQEELAKRLQETRSEKYFYEAVKLDIILIAEEDDQIVGYVEFGHVDLAIKEIRKGDQEFSRLYILASYQRRGIGKGLMDAALEHPRLRNANNIYLGVWEENEVAQRLYKKYGFEATGMMVDSDIIMVRRRLPVTAGSVSLPLEMREGN
jgi:ribosomal protein S18 acetylase RimI-like enzyme